MLIAEARALRDAHARGQRKSQSKYTLTVELLKAKIVLKESRSQ